MKYLILIIMIVFIVSTMLTATSSQYVKTQTISIGLNIASTP